MHAGQLGLEVMRVLEARLHEGVAALAALAGSDQVTPPSTADGWLVVRIAPQRSSEVNRALAQAGIYASGLSAGSDLEGLFLELTAGEEREPAA